MPRFELSDGKSRKFWEISVEGPSYTVRYGRVGTSGRSSTKEFASADKAAAAAEKLIRQKTKKGYAPVSGDADAASPPERSAPPPPKAPPKPTPSTTRAAAEPTPLRPSGAGVWTKMELGGAPLAIASDGRIVVTSYRSPTDWWKVVAPDGTTLHEVQGDRLSAAAFSPDGTRIVVGDRGGEKVSVYGASEFNLIASRRLLTYDVIFTPTGDRVVVTGESSVTICGADTLGYQCVLKARQAQRVHFVGREIVMGCSSQVVAVVDPGPREESKKKPKARLPDDAWRFPKGGPATFEGDRVLLWRGTFDRQTRSPVSEGEKGVRREFSTTGRAEARQAEGEPTEFRRVGEASPFAVAVAEWSEDDMDDWHVSPDGTRMVVRGGTWRQTEFPDSAAPVKATEVRAIAPGFREGETLAAVVYGVRVELALDTARALADALGAAQADGWAAIPGGDATSTTAYGPADRVPVAVGLVVANALAAGQGEPGPPQRVQSEAVAGAAKAWGARPDAVRQALELHAVGPDQEPECLLVASGPLALARLSRRGKSDQTEDVTVVKITGDVKLSAQYD